jgi:hypothetical protein
MSQDATVTRILVSNHMDAMDKLSEARRLLSSNDTEALRRAAMAAEAAAETLNKLYRLERRVRHALAQTA